MILTIRDASEPGDVLFESVLNEEIDPSDSLNKYSEELEELSKLPLIKSEVEYHEGARFSDSPFESDFIKSITFYVKSK